MHGVLTVHASINTLLIHVLLSLALRQFVVGIPTGTVSQKRPCKILVLRKHQSEEEEVRPFGIWQMREGEMCYYYDYVQMLTELELVSGYGKIVPLDPS